jgi:hypothetical protein
MSYCLRVSHLTPATQDCECSLDKTCHGHRKSETTVDLAPHLHQPQVELERGPLDLPGHPMCQGKKPLTGDGRFGCGSPEAMGGTGPERVTACCKAEQNVMTERHRRNKPPDQDRPGRRRFAPDLP